MSLEQGLLVFMLTHVTIVLSSLWFFFTPTETEEAQPTLARVYRFPERMK